MIKYPRNSSELADLSKAIEEFVLPGFLPPEPIINLNSIVRTQGSCFAREIAKALTVANIQCRYMPFKEVVNSPLANRLLFEHVLDPNKPYSSNAHEEMFSQNLCGQIRTKIATEDVFIFTIGVAPIWYRKGQSTPVFWFDPRNIDEFEFKFTSVDENTSAIDFIVDALKQLNPKIKVVLTVSPVPLNRASGQESVIAADCVSKSILRVATFNYFNRRPENTYYWPSFEMVRWLGGHLPPVYGADDGNLRHVNQSMVDQITSLFLKYFAERNITDGSVSD